MFNALQAIQAGQMGEQAREKRERKNAFAQAGESYMGGDYKGAAGALMPYDMGAGIRMAQYGQQQAQTAETEQLRKMYESTKLLAAEPDVMRRIQMAQGMSEGLGIPAPTDPSEYTDDVLQRELDEMRIKGGFEAETPEAYTLAPGARRFVGDQMVAENPKAQDDGVPWYITDDGLDPRYERAQAAGRDQTVINNNMGADGEVYRSISDVPEGEPIPTALLGGYKPDTGFFAVRDANAPGGFTMVPFDGGKVDRADTNRQTRQERAGGTVVQDLGRALNMVGQEGVTGEIASGPLFGLTKWVPGMPAWEVNQHLQSALSNIGIDQLQAMRDASPTGGALGQIPVQQQKRLEQMLGSLDPQAPDHVLENNIKRAMNIYLDIIHGNGQGPERFDLNFDHLGRPLAPRPEGVTQEEWIYMEPEDRELFE